MDSIRILRALRAVKASSDGTFGCIGNIAKPSEVICVFKGTPRSCTTYPCPLTKITCYNGLFEEVKCTEKARRIAEALRQDPNSEDLDFYTSYPKFSYTATGNPLQDFVNSLMKGITQIGMQALGLANPVTAPLEIYSFASQWSTGSGLWEPYSAKGLVVALMILTNGERGEEGKKELAKAITELFSWMKDNVWEELFWARFLLRVLSLKFSL